MNLKTNELNMSQPSQTPKDKGDLYRKNSTINMRIDPQRRALIEAAAKSLSMDRTSFVINAAYQAAQETLLDQRVLILSEDDFMRFERALNKPDDKGNSCLRKLMKKTPAWA